MKYLSIILLSTIMFACTQEETTSDEVHQKEVQIVELQNKIEQLSLENKQKDSAINEAISYFNEIRDNLMRINLKEEDIRLKSENPELTKDDKNWILQEINNINQLRKDNVANMKVLRQQIKDKDIEIKEFQTMVQKLTLEIQQKNKEIEQLQNDLADLNMEYAALFDDYQEQVELALDVMKELNTVYYAYGTKEELIKNNVLIQEGGFLGIGKKTNMAENFNEDYFQKLDKTKIHDITIRGGNPEIITDHPHTSYKWEGDKLIILDENQFWKISNYLIIVVK